MSFYELKIRLSKFTITLAMIFDLLAGGFACYISTDPLIPFLAYATDVVSLYICTEKRQMLAVLASLGLSAYSVILLRNEPAFLSMIAMAFKCTIPFFKGWLILRSDIRELINVTYYLRENLQILFILPFMVLLVLAAIKLAFGDAVMANWLAIYAYYQLIGAAVAVVVSRANAENRHWN
jgi:hypothetical protein